MTEPNQKPEGGSATGSSFARPQTRCGTLPTAFICAAAVIIVYLLASPKPQEARRLWTPVVVETNGTQTALGDTRKMEFWTPSVKTRDYLKGEGGTVNGKEKWQIIASDDVIVKFGATLHANGKVLGYRRVEVWGQGRTGYKPGWWWSVNVTPNCPVSELARAYQDFWKPPSPIFIEVIDNRGNDK